MSTHADKPEPKEKKAKPETFANVKPQDMSAMQVTEVSNVYAPKADKEGTLKNNPLKADKKK